MNEPPSLEHAAEQWARWFWNLGLAIFQRGAQPGRSAEVAREDVSRALAAQLAQVVQAAQASPHGTPELIAAGLRIQADVLARTADVIVRASGEEPEAPDG